MRCIMKHIRIRLEDAGVGNGKGVAIVYSDDSDPIEIGEKGYMKVLNHAYQEVTINFEVVFDGLVKDYFPNGIEDRGNKNTIIVDGNHRVAIARRI